MVVVDTNMPVPRFVSRLRVDAFTEAGVWFESRDIRLPDPRDWPVSFGVVAPTDDDGGAVVLRLRGYPDGRTRTYRGERYKPPASFSEPFVPHSTAEMCAAPPMLEVGETVVVKRGREPFTSLDNGGDCEELYSYFQPPWLSQVGATAVAVEIDEAGDYTFGMLDVAPMGIIHAAEDNADEFTQVSIQLRRQCESSLTALGCDTGIHPSLNPLLTELPEVTVEDLQPGRYHLVASGRFYWDGPAEMLIAATRRDQWPPATPEDPWSQPFEVPAPLPLELEHPTKETPAREPVPSVTIDRLVHLTISPTKRHQAQVLLDGACVGQMAKVGLPTDGWLAETATCTGGEAPAGPPESPTTSSDLSIGSSPSLQGTFGRGQPCPEDEGGSVVCVPGGMFHLGDQRQGLLPTDDGDDVAERVAVLSRFWMDRFEVTVARYRQTLSDPSFNPSLRDRPYRDPNGLCPWTEQPGPHEELALSCISWYGARDFCRHHGGDLPTRAQWEYAASAADRDFETDYPWGDDPPRCDCSGLSEPCHVADVERFPPFSLGVPGQCWDPEGPLPLRPRPQTELAHEHGDLTTLGLVSLGGGLSEFVLDSTASLSSDCWRAAPLIDPVCFEDEAIRRDTKGGSYAASLALALNWLSRGFAPGNNAYLEFGFRCVYPEPPLVVP